MLLDTTLSHDIGLNQVPAIARAVEAAGFRTLWTTETQHDPFLPGPLIAEHTQNLSFGTAIAVSFARSPATLAYTAWDLAQASQGRFILGLGTQVKPHIERRFGMPWPESPVGKLREQIQAIRAFWHTWQTGERLNFRGDYYKLSLMNPLFNPGPSKYPDIPIFIAGVNKGLARLAGEAADGFVVHPFHSPKYLEEVLRPAMAAGAEQAGRPVSACQISVTAFVITNPEEDQFARWQIAFYASTPTYRGVMALHGWEAEAEELSALVSRGRWDAISGVITDDMLDTFAIVAEGPEQAGAALKARYEGLADRLGLYMPFVPGQRDAFWQKLSAALN